MKALQQDLKRLEATDTQVLGVSMDSAFANKAFADQIGVTFPLLSDWGGEVTHKYGIYLDKYKAARRVNFLIGKDGKILEEHNASLPNYEVRFNKKVRGGTAGANIQLAQGKTVHGVLYKVEEGAMRSLDRYEGVPDHYRRIEVQVTPEGGQPVPAQIYIASKLEKGLRPSPACLQAMLDGAGEHNLPASYIGEIKTAAGAA